MVVRFCFLTGNDKHQGIYVGVHIGERTDQKETVTKSSPQGLVIGKRAQTELFRDSYNIVVEIKNKKNRVAGCSSDMGSEHYCLRWNNHQSNLLGVFSQLLESESLVDVTLACTEGPSIRAHKVVLSACSSYFQALFLDHPNRHPIVILKDVRFAELRTLVDFMYKGEVNVEYCQLSALLKTAESLKVKGLADMTNINAAVASREEQQTQQQQSQSQSQSQQQNLQAQQQQQQQQQSQQQQSQQHDRSSECLLRESSREQHHRERDSIKDSNSCGGKDAASFEETRGSLSPISVHSGPSDMSLSNNTTGTPGVLPLNLPQNRLPSPHSTEPLAGPSGLPPVQQVPLVSILN
ncbi:hypothetical protein M0804_002859 [Polistes exclamans]|nr:hypothetical protein M0804_002859 [Polistes exclamans]